MKYFKYFISLLFFVFTFLNFYKTTLAQDSEETLEGSVVFVSEQKEIEIAGNRQTYQKLQIEITKGSIKGQNILVENGNFLTTNPVIYKSKDKVLIQKSKDLDGKDTYYISDYIRRTPLYMLFAIFTFISVFIGGKRGLFSLFGMSVSFLIIFLIIIPLILKGYDPIVVSIGGAALIIPATFYLSHGISSKTHLAVLGTLVSLVITGLLAAASIDLVKLSGFASEEASYLQSQVGNLVNIKGLLLAGIIISCLGILDDITISQSSIVFELKSANSKLKFHELFFRTMKVGRDHISSLVNTLVLVYAGSAFPLLLLFTENSASFSQVINYEIVADEIVRALVGSIGLILAVPITTFFAALYFSNKKS